MVIDVELTGDRLVSGVERQPRAACADLLSTERLSGQALLQLPSPHTVSGHVLVVAIGILGFHGPGDYTHEVRFTGEDANVSVDGTRYTAASQSAGGFAATVHGDGSGTLKVIKLSATDTRSIAGTMSWTCTAPG